MEIQVGDILTMKKPHPCGSKDWQVLRIGADFKLRCSGCGHITHLNCDHLQSLREHLAQSHHFRIDTCHTVLSGLCGSCMEQEVPHGAH